MIFTPHHGLIALLIWGGPEQVLGASKSSLPPQLSSCTWIVFLTWAAPRGHTCSQKLLQEASARFNSNSTYTPRAARQRSQRLGRCLQTSQSLGSSEYQNIEILHHSVPCHSLISVPKTILPVPGNSGNLTCSHSFLKPLSESSKF